MSNQWPNQYAKRDHMEQGEHFVMHMNQMTAEGLYDKAAIAGELAHRDIEIDSLKKRIAELETVVRAHITDIRQTAAMLEVTFGDRLANTVSEIRTAADELEAACGGKVEP